MSTVKDLLPLWLRDHAKGRREIEAQCRAALARLKNTAGTYAFSIAKMAELHAAAAKVYEDALASLDGKESP